MRLPNKHQNIELQAHLAGPFSGQCDASGDFVAELGESHGKYLANRQKIGGFGFMQRARI
jgi:hypothetical protein